MEDTWSIGTTIHNVGVVLVGLRVLRMCALTVFTTQAHLMQRMAHARCDIE